MDTGLSAHSSRNSSDQTIFWLWLALVICGLLSSLRQRGINTEGGAEALSSGAGTKIAEIAPESDKAPVQSLRSKPHLTPQRVSSPSPARSWTRETTRTLLTTLSYSFSLYNPISQRT